MKLFEHVEITKVGEACVIYDVKNNNHVETLLVNLKQHIQEAFIPEEIIFDDTLTTASAVTDILFQKKSYADTLQNFYSKDVKPTKEIIV